MDNGINGLRNTIIGYVKDFIRVSIIVYLVGVILTGGDTGIANLSGILLVYLINEAITPESEIWACDFCGKEASFEGGMEKHVVICEYNPESKYYRGREVIK